MSPALSQNGLDERHRAALPSFDTAIWRLMVDPPAICTFGIFEQDLEGSEEPVLSCYAAWPMLL